MRFSNFPSFKSHSIYRHIGITIGLSLATGFLHSAIVPKALAGQDLETSQYLSQIVINDNERAAFKKSGAKPSGQEIIAPGQPEAPAEVGKKHNIAVLPQLGYDPTSGFIIGGKLADNNFSSSNLNMDLGATYATSGDASFDLSFGDPNLFGGHQWIGLIKFTKDLSPGSDFYGLGNNSTGGTTLATYNLHRTKANFTLGYRLAPHWVAALDIGFDKISIGKGSPSGNTPSALTRFPNLPGLHGNYNNPVALSLIYNTQRDLTRPTHGWNNIVKIQHVGPELGNSVNYTRYLADFKYTLPVFSSKNILGFRLDGEYVDGSGNNLPFYEMASIGGSNNLEGFKSDRFLGQSRVFAQIGYRRLLADFDFYNIWRVRIDGALFGGAGRVFLNRSKLPHNLSRAATPDLSSKFRYSYGTGVRIDLGEALTARIDIGFSKNNKAQAFLEFGNRF